MSDSSDCVPDGKAVGVPDGKAVGIVTVGSSSFPGKVLDNRRAFLGSIVGIQTHLTQIALSKGPSQLSYCSRSIRSQPITDELGLVDGAAGSISLEADHST